jgi:hypothetical protein
MNQIKQPLMKRFFPVAAVLLASSAIGLQGCSSTNEAPKAAVAPAPAPAAAAPAPAWKQGMGADMSSSKLAP